MKIKLLFYLFLITGIVLSCDEQPEQAALDGLTNIRVENISDFDFSEVEVIAPGGEAKYGEITSKDTSDYYPFGVAYRYAFIKVTIGQEQFVLQPIDYVGEQPLGPGNYTYVIDVPDLNSPGITLVLIAD